VSVERHISAALAADRLWVSAVSVWEIALLVSQGRVDLRRPVRPWAALAESVAGLNFMALDHVIAVGAVELPDLRGDPADRFLVATAERLGAALVTRDRQLRRYKGIVTLWA